MYNVVNMCGSDIAKRCNCFEGEPVRNTEVDVRIKKFKISKAARNDDVA